MLKQTMNELHLFIDCLSIKHQSKEFLETNSKKRFLY